MISIHALRLILDEVERVGKNEGDISVDDCGCVLRKTCGLPCAHELVEYVLEDKPIPIDVVDGFWKKLGMEEKKHQAGEDSDEEVRNRYTQIKVEIDAYFDASTLAERILICKRMREAYVPSTTPLVEPDASIPTRGRPKVAKPPSYKSTKRNPSKFEYVESKIDSYSPSPSSSFFFETGPTVNPPMFSKTKREKLPVTRRLQTRSRASNDFGFMDRLPSTFQSHILGTKYVMGDGHCGFRCVAELMGYNVDSWGRVRGELFIELSNNSELYERTFIMEKRVDKILGALYCYEMTAPKKNWFTLPEMGHLTASYYNVALITLSSTQSLTYLPLRTSIPTESDPKVICIAFINNNHFIQVHLKDGHPLPPVCIHWEHLSNSEAKSWLSYLRPRLDAYNPSASMSVHQSVETVSLDE